MVGLFFFLNFLINKPNENRNSGRRFQWAFLIKRSWISVVDKWGDSCTMNVLSQVGGDWRCAQGTETKRKNPPLKKCTPQKLKAIYESIFLQTDQFFFLVWPMLKKWIKGSVSFSRCILQNRKIGAKTLIQLYRRQWNQQSQRFFLKNNFLNSNGFRNSTSSTCYWRKDIFFIAIHCYKKPPSCFDNSTQCVPLQISACVLLATDKKELFLFPRLFRPRVERKWFSTVKVQ